MLEVFFNQMLPDLVQNVSVITFFVVFLGGLLTSLSPCIISMIPVMVGYTGSQSERSRTKGFVISLLFVLGMSVTFAILGVVAALLGQIFGQIGKVWYYVIAIVAIVMGLQLTGVIEIRFPTLKRMPLKSGGVLTPFFMGMLFGLVASPCATPVLAVIMTYIAAQGNIPIGASMLFVYGLGHGIPLLAAGTFAAFLTSLTRFQRWSRYITAASGAFLILFGLYFLILARWY